MEVDEAFADVEGDAVYEQCKFTKFDPAPREDNWRNQRRSPDYFLVSQTFVVQPLAMHQCSPIEPRPSVTKADLFPLPFLCLTPLSLSHCSFVTSSEQATTTRRPPTAAKGARTSPGGPAWIIEAAPFTRTSLPFLESLVDAGAAGLCNG